MITLKLGMEVISYTPLLSFISLGIEASNDYRRYGSRPKLLQLRAFLSFFLFEIHTPAICLENGVLQRWRTALGKGPLLVARYGVFLLMLVVVPKFCFT